MEIAVLTGQNGATAPVQAEGVIQVYKHSCNIWELRRSIPFALQSACGLKAMRDYMQTVIELLGECRTFVGLSVNGLPFFEMEKAGFTIWEMEGAAPDLLDTILEETNAEKESSPPLNIVLYNPEPREVSPGHYFISLKEIQNCNGMITSKQILIPLLKNKQYQKLEILCLHIPPWLELKMISGEIDGTIEKISSTETRVTICGSR